MSELSNCPKCGKTELKEQGKVFDRHSNKPVSILRNLIGGGVMTILGGFMLVLCIWAIISPERPEDRTAGTINLWLAVPLLLLGIQLVTRYLKAERQRLYSFQCACGHHWERWESGWGAETCTKCSEAKVTDRPIRVREGGASSRKVFGARVLPNRIYFLFLGWIAVLGGLALIGMAVFMVIELGLFPLNDGLLVKLLLPVIGLGLIAWGSGTMVQYFGGNTVLMHVWRCAACGHQWENTKA